MKKLLSTLVFLIGILSALQAQKITIVEGGDLAFLKGESLINAEFQYHNMSVGKMSEEEYLEKRIQELNAKETKRGDSWAIAWADDRQILFEPKFTQLFNEKGNLKIDNTQPHKYTLILHTTFTEPGFNVGVVRRNAYIDAVVYIVETANPSKILTKIHIDNAPGRTVGGFDFSTGSRLVEAYAISGKKLATVLKKKIK